MATSYFSKLFDVLKLSLLAALGVLGGGLLLSLLILFAPLVLVYFLFDRLCDTVETFAPKRTRRKRKKGPNLFSLINHVTNQNSTGATRSTV